MRIRSPPILGTELSAQDRYPPACCRAGASATYLPVDRRPHAPRPPPGRPHGRAWPASAGPRRRLGHRPTHRPTLTQRLPAARPRRPATAPGPGRRPQADPRPRRALATGGPRRTGGTYAELADPLDKSKGIRVQKSARQVFCSRPDIRPSRPPSRFLRGDPVQQAATREDRAAWKPKRRRVHSSC